MEAFHQHWNINPLHVDVQCRRQSKILHFFQQNEIHLLLLFVMTTNEEPGDKVICSPYTVACHFTLNNGNE